MRATATLHPRSTWIHAWNSSADPIRIIEAVTAGVAFLAAGAHGVACGAGDYTLAVFGTVFALIVLLVLGRLERAARKGSNDENTRQP